VTVTGDTLPADVVYWAVCRSRGRGLARGEEKRFARQASLPRTAAADFATESGTLNDDRSAWNHSVFAFQKHFVQGIVTTGLKG